MNKELDFSLPSRQTTPPRNWGPIQTILLIAIFFLGILGLVDPFSGSAGNHKSSMDHGLSADQQKDMALKLEGQGLAIQAAMAWETYIQQIQPSAEDAARIQYRIGKLYQEAGEFESALTAYYRSEAMADLQELSHEIGRRVAVCLESLGKFAALRQALDERVNATPDDADGSQVVAEIGPEKITRTQLDREIERQIDLQLTQFAAALPEQARHEQKEAMLRQFSDNAQRRQFLNQMIAQELLFRKALEENLAEDPSIQKRLRESERSVLIQAVLEKQVQDQIHITPGDVQTYFQANHAQYATPQQIRISHIVCKDEEQARAVLKKLNDGSDFGSEAMRVSMDDATRDQAGEIDRWWSKESLTSQLGLSDSDVQALFEARPGQTFNAPIEGASAWHVIQVREHREAHTPSLDEAKTDVYRDLHAQKIREVQSQLMQSLKEQHDVVIHQDAFSFSAPTE